jgi:hypothetical protein
LLQNKRAVKYSEEVQVYERAVHEKFREQRRLLGLKATVESRQAYILNRSMQKRDRDIFSTHSPVKAGDALRSIDYEKRQYKNQESISFQIPDEKA